MADILLSEGHLYLVHFIHNITQHILIVCVHETIKNSCLFVKAITLTVAIKVAL